ncbi:oligosaccharide flippase family protein [Spirosoma litoris]
MQPEKLIYITLKEKFQPYYVIISNFGYLSILQIFNLIVPIITYPYLIKVLGAEIYGTIIYTQTVVGYLVIVINFGFNTIGTKEISEHRNDVAKTTEICSSIFIIKGALFIASCLILYIYILQSNQPTNIRILYYLNLSQCMYEFLFPLWYFQGVEKMKYITIITLINRIIFLILIFILIRSKNDFLLFPAILGIGSILSCVIGLKIAGKNGLKFTWQPLVVLIAYIRKAYVIAISYSMNIFRVNLNVMLIKHYFSYTEVAYFDLAIKIMTIGTTFLDLISQSVFPRMSQIKDIKFLKKIILMSLIVAVLMMVIVQLFAPYIVEILGGGGMYTAINFTRLLAINLPIYVVGALLGSNCLIVHGYNKSILYSIIYSSLFFLGFLYVSINILEFKKIDVFIYAYVLSYLFQAMYRYVICKSRNLI